MWPFRVKTRIASALSSLAMTTALLTSFWRAVMRSPSHGIGAAAALDAGGDAVEDLDAFQRVFADGGFAAEHDGVGLLENGVGDVGDFGAGGHGGFDHAFEHVGGDDDRSADAQAGFDDAPLDDGQFFVGDFDAQIAARDHDAVGFAHDGSRFLMASWSSILAMTRGRGLPSSNSSAVGGGRGLRARRTAR